MPCKCDYPDPTKKEIYLRETANLLLYVGEKLNIPLPEHVARDANNEYCRNESLVPLLCGILTELDDDSRDALVYNGKDPKARRLADWWDHHLEADKERLAKEAILDSYCDLFRLKGEEVWTKGKLLTTTIDGRYVVEVLMSQTNLKDVETRVFDEMK